jgi:hypothetical protein
MRHEPIEEWDRHRRRAPQRTDITGLRSGLLTADKPIAINRWGIVIWRCDCDCGEEAQVASNSLRSGVIRSCGCSRKRAR